jgi:hypothetical protein
VALSVTTDPPLMGNIMNPRLHGAAAGSLDGDHTVGVARSPRVEAGSAGEMRRAAFRCQSAEVGRRTKASFE